MGANPELGERIRTGTFESNVQLAGSGELVLSIHGREDGVIPLANSLKLAEWVPNAQLHVFGHCGHWTQIEHSARFNRLVGDFLAEADT